MLVGATLPAACFSERAQVTAPTGGRCSVPLDPSVVGTTLVAIRDFAFAPTELRIKAGTTVTWVNCEPPATPSHTSTSDQGVWNSPLLDPGTTFSRTFDQPGTFAFHCEPHPFMTATVVVE